jgi:hypothetical protein
VCFHPEVQNWSKFAVLEERHWFISGEWRVSVQGLEFFGDKSI